MFVNIINNAHDALTEKGGGALSVRSVRQNGVIAIEFADDGPGIARENIKKVFDPFFTTKEVGKGTGLGLSMAYGIIKEHGGMIEAESVPGKGARFIVKLPIIIGSQEKLEKRDRQAERVSAGESKAILVIEDEQALREMIAEALSESGYLVDAVSNGEDAIDWIGKRRYDAVISDIKMPGISGKEIYTYVQKNHPDLADRILFITGDVLSRDTQTFIKITRNKFIEKPFGIEKLLHILGEVLADH